MSLTLSEARDRSALVSGVSTVVDLDLTRSDYYRCRALITFECTDHRAATFIELAEAAELEVRLNGQLLISGESAHPDGYDGERIALAGLQARNTLEISAAMPYVNNGDGMHQVVDPADGERYVCGYTAMDIAHRVLPCFDQPDLKSTFELTVTAPPHWTVLANGLAARTEDGTSGQWSFGATPPISPYLFFVTGGPFHSVVWEEPYGEGSLPFGWHARASLAAELDRDAAQLRRITSQCFAHYTRIFDAPYPFADYQQVFTPGLNWGAMEFPGCVAFRDELLFRGSATAIQLNSRASTIAHEMAHMWFGDLVTMRWWEDTWLNESFADYMGYEVAGRAAGYSDSWVAAGLRRKPTAYQADRRRSTHPIAASAEDVADVDTAFGNFDMITYAKGNAVLHQLVTWLGEDDFLAGVNRYLSAHQFGNATLADFLDALDAGTERDVRSWARAWLSTTGYDTIRVTRSGDVPVITRSGSRPHRCTVSAYDTSLNVAGRRMIDLDSAPVRLPEYAGLVIVPNSQNETYAELVLDPLSWSVLRGGLGRIEDAETRALLWATAAARTEGGALRVDDLVAMAEQLAGELHPVVFEGGVSLVAGVLRKYADPVELPDFLGTMAEVASAVLAQGDERAGAAARLLASLSPEVAPLADWLDGGSMLRATDQEVRWLILHRLASLGDDSRLAAESERDRSTAGELGFLRAQAAVPRPEAKRAAWARLMSGTLSNREFEAVGSGFWGWEQAELVEDYLAAYVHDGLALGRASGQAFGKVIGSAFPWLPLNERQRGTLRDELARTLAGEVPTVLARTWNDRLDDLDSVIAARQATGSK